MAKVAASSITMQFSVSEISKLTWVLSPEVLLHGIPWQVMVKKHENGTQKSLGVYLCCPNNNKSSTAVGCATIKLLPFDDNQRAVEHYIPPFVYAKGNPLSFGPPDMIQWNDLLNVGKKYVKYDTIRLEAKIEAEDPNNFCRSILKFNRINKACDCCGPTSFQLTVMNVSNLIAVRTPEFIMRGMPWHITVLKNATYLGVRLELSKCSGTALFQDVTMTVKLVSAKENVDPIEKTDTEDIRPGTTLYMENVVSWSKLLKPENGFVNGNSITLKIEIKSNKLDDVVPNANSKCSHKPNPFVCSICLEKLGSQVMSTTPCGHSFCTACITAAVRNSGLCPLCRGVVQSNDLRPLYLSADNWNQNRCTHTNKKTTIKRCFLLIFIILLSILFLTVLSATHPFSLKRQD